MTGEQHDPADLAIVAAIVNEPVDAVPLFEPTPPLRRGPELEQTRTGRLYHWQGLTYWSVTSLIGGGLPKPQLKAWGERTVAEAAVDSLGFVGQMARDDRDGAVDWLKRAPFRTSGGAAKLGTSVHEAAEAYVLGRPMPPPAEQLVPYLASFEAFLEEFSPTFEAVEAPVFNRTQRYAGTLDAIVEIENAELAFTFGVPDASPLRLLIDYKTSRSGIFAETALQLAAYRNGETFLGLPSADEAPMPEVHGCAAIWLRPDGYSLVPVRADDEVYRAFLFVREVARFAWETSSTVIGREIRRARSRPAP